MCLKVSAFVLRVWKTHDLPNRDGSLIALQRLRSDSSTSLKTNECSCRNGLRFYPTVANVKMTRSSAIEHSGQSGGGMSSYRGTFSDFNHIFRFIHIEFHGSALRWTPAGRCCSSPRGGVRGRSTCSPWSGSWRWRWPSNSSSIPTRVEIGGFSASLLDSTLFRTGATSTQTHHLFL